MGRKYNNKNLIPKKSISQIVDDRASCEDILTLVLKDGYAIIDTNGKFFIKILLQQGS